MSIKSARKYFFSSKSRSYFIGRSYSSAPKAMAQRHSGRLIERYLSSSPLSMGITSGRGCIRLESLSNMSSSRSYQLRCYSSEAEVQDADDGGHIEKMTEETSHNEAQPEKPAAESVKTTTSRLSNRGERFKDEFLSKIVPWEKIPVSFDNFPYYTDDTKSLLVECVVSHLKQNKFRKYGGILKHSSNRIQLQSMPGTDLYREKLVSAVARELQVPLLRLDSSVLPPYDISQHCSTELESDQDSDENEDESTDHEEEDEQTSAKLGLLKKGDRVKYNGETTSITEVNNRTLSHGHRGEVHEVKGDKVAVIFNDCGLVRTEAKMEGKSPEHAAQETVTWLDAKDVKRVEDAQTHDCYVAMELLYEVLQSQQPMIVYFPDSFFSSLSEAPLKERSHFFDMSSKMFDKLSGHVVLICGQNKMEAGLKEMEKYPASLKLYIMRLRSTTSGYGIDKLFTNVMCIKPPKDKDMDSFIKQIEEDRTTVISEGNLSRMHQVIKAHRLLCTDLEQANTTDMILTIDDVEKIVAWATSHYLSSCPLPCVKEDLLHIPHESLKLAILRLKEQRKPSPSPSSSKEQKSIQDLAEGEYEEQLISAVVCAGDIGVKFDDVGALEHVKRTLHEAVILPLRRPELFARGNLKRTCNGVLLFGPPGTGKTLMAKALATESGANFINITTATLESKLVGESEKLTKALFSYARKLAPTIIFLDEVDSMLAARGHNVYDTSRVNEFMAAWDGLISKDSERILVIGATNRPFGLDDAIIRRMPRRIYVGLPDAINRVKILKVLLREENLEPEFCVKKLAEATEGYSGSDLKNLCVAAAYRPVKELLERESKGEKSEEPAELRPLNIDDYIHCKARVRPSVSSDSRSIRMLQEWDEKYGEGGRGSTCERPFGF